MLLCSAGDTHPTRTLNELAEGTDMLIQQIMGPLPAFDTLSFESQYLLNVSQRTPPALTLPLGVTASLQRQCWPNAECRMPNAECADICCGTVMLILSVL